MLKKVVNYTDYDGNPATETYCFNLNKVECMDINFEYDEYGGLIGYMKQLVQNVKNGKDCRSEMWSFLKKLIHRSVGRQSADGRRFEKSEDIIKDFEQTNAYSEFVFGLINEPDGIPNFMTGVLPDTDPEAVERAKTELAKQGLEFAELSPTIS